uniref:transposase n=1 Tax=Planococcus lenghuensis TaxID=2213202 RepID=UPI0009851183|nr:transposase [Planococcus lenghuensis]
MKKLEESFDDATQFLNEPSPFLRFLSSTNHLERMNQEVRRREHVIRIFPNQQSAFRLIGAVLMEEDQKYWTKRSIMIPDAGNTFF